MIYAIYCFCVVSIRKGGWQKIKSWILKLLVLLRWGKVRTAQLRRQGGDTCCPIACQKPCEEWEGAYEGAKDVLWLSPASADILQLCWCTSWWLLAYAEAFVVLRAQNWRSSNTENQVVFSDSSCLHWQVCGAALPSEMALVQLLRSGEISIWLHPVSTRRFNASR